MAATDTAQPYQYQALHHPDSIRILELLPGAAGTTLQCKLHKVRMSSRPRFEALSYTWGAPIFPKQLTETTTTSPSIISITENLFSALQAFRLPLASRKLWIDAVCINQQDTSEKSLQVRKMGEIYSDAEIVVVWLGKEDCAAGVAQLQQIGQDCQLYGFEKVFPFPTKIRDHAAAENLETLVESCDGAAVLEFLDREWFERVWIVQEFILAKNLVVCSGRSEISYDLFSKAICVLRLMTRRMTLMMLIVQKESLLSVILSGRLDLSWGLIQMRERHLVLNAQGLTTVCGFPTSLEGPSSDAAVGEVDNIVQGPREKELGKASVEYPLDVPIHRSTLVEYWVGARTLKCTNERDRVFGMLGFAGDTLSIKPDYDSSPEQVWNDLAVKSLLSGDLTVLHWARGVPSDDSVRGFSFVADLGNIDSEATRLGGNGTPNFQAGSQVAVQVELLTLGLPKLRGVVIDSIYNECFLGLQARASVTGEEDAVISSSSTGVYRHGQEQGPVIIDKGALIQLFKICQSWLLESAFQYEEGFTAAFARTIIADNALPLTRELIGDEKGILVLYLVLHLLSQEISGIGDGQLFVPDTDVAKSLGGSFSLGLRMFEGDEPKFYHFPAEDGPDLILTNPDDNTTQTFVEITEPLKARLIEYKGAVSRLLHTWSLFSTAKGYIGIGPKGMAQDDDVVVFEGAQTPFVLRRVGVSVPQASSRPMPVHREFPVYQVVGECYLHGWMHGEAMDKDCGLELKEFVLI